MPRSCWQLGVRAVYTPKDFNLNAIMGDMVDVIREATGCERLAACGIDRSMTPAPFPIPSSWRYGSCAASGRRLPVA
jgi:hypothetical protein